MIEKFFNDFFNTVDVERSFSKFKQILLPNRMNLLKESIAENMLSVNNILSFNFVIPKSFG